MEAIMCMGVGTANSILVVSFAKERLLHHGDPVEAAIEAGFTRFRPVAHDRPSHDHRMIPMALGLGEGGAAECTAGPRCNRRPTVRYGGHAGFSFLRSSVCYTDDVILRLPKHGRRQCPNNSSVS